MDFLYNHEIDQTDEGYSDFLTDVLKTGWFGSIKFAAKSYDYDRHKHNVPRSPVQVWKSVLDADRVQWIITTIAREEEKDKQVILKEATNILKEMAYKDHMTLVRSLGFALYHVMNAIYHEGVYYNTENLQLLKDTIRQHPVIIMPSHRSYMDFLIISVLCVHLNLPLPAIAAGMDFMRMGGGMSYLLRASGAFFMRRSFGSDRLYWAIFTEYIHTIIINGDRPIEFFIEGTRSRSGKSLNPKLGLFSLVSEPYLKAQIYDVMIVPTSISYDRILEESLYAYELLGVPKPKESTSGLFKASGILVQNYGSIHVHFAEPISIREDCGQHNRSVHACYPRYMLRLTNQEQSYLETLAYKVLLVQQSNMVISLWQVVAMILCQTNREVKYEDLLEKVQWLHEVLRKCKIKTRIFSGSLSDGIRNKMVQYDHLVAVDSHEAKEATVRIKGGYGQNMQPQLKHSTLEASIRETAAIHLMLACYRNQLIHVFVRPSLVTFVLDSSFTLSDQSPEAAINHSSVRQEFDFLRTLFYKEFIFAPNQSEADYMQGINFLHMAGALHKKGVILHFSARGRRLMSFLKAVLHPFMSCYSLVCEYIHMHHNSCEMKQLCISIQLWIAKRIQEKGILPEILSLDMINNGIHGLARVGVLNINKVKSYVKI